MICRIRYYQIIKQTRGQTSYATGPLMQFYLEVGGGTGYGEPHELVGMWGYRYSFTRFNDFQSDIIVDIIFKGTVA